MVLGITFSPEMRRAVPIQETLVSLVTRKGLYPFHSPVMAMVAALTTLASSLSPLLQLQ
jgi:hypothetical protein